MVEELRFSKWICFLQAYILLFVIKITMRWFGFARVHRVLGVFRASRARKYDEKLLGSDDALAQEIWSAVWLASRYQILGTTCLERSLVLYRLLGLYGVQADLCIGVQKIPFASHAWVEHNGSVLNDVKFWCAAYSVILRESNH
jgi:hypothetical protein